MTNAILRSKTPLTSNSMLPFSSLSANQSEFSGLESVDSDSMFDHLSFMELLRGLLVMDVDLAIHKHGYEKLNKICDTTQGEIYKAQKLNLSEEDATEYVVIKRTERGLLAEGIAIKDGITYCVADDCIKEAEIMQYLRQDDMATSKHIVKYIDFFQSETDLFLVMEHIESEMNLKKFITQAKAHIDSGELCMKHYQKTVHRLLWELFVTVQWLHVKKKCCHLNLRSENILLQSTFIEKQDGLRINPDIRIKLGDFSLSELFINGNNYLCTTQSSCFTDAYSAPKVFNDEIYDARAADNWSLGMILFECISLGERIYNPLDVSVLESGYSALHDGKLEQYLKQKNFFGDFGFNIDSFAILNGLLNVDESERLNGLNMLKMKWFEMFYENGQIESIFS